MLSIYYIIDDGLVLICGRSRHKCMSLYSLLGHKKINDASRHINLTMRFKFKNCWLDDDVQEDLESRALQLPLGQSIIVVESFMSAKDCKTSKSPMNVSIWLATNSERVILFSLPLCVSQDFYETFVIDNF